MYMDDSSSEGSSSSSIPDITLTTPRQSTMNLSSEGSTSSTSGLTTPTQRTVNLSSSDLEGRTVSPDMKDYYSSYNVNVTTERAEMPDYSSVWREVLDSKELNSCISGKDSLSDSSTVVDVAVETLENTDIPDLDKFIDNPWD